jgi:hypothetical protein
LVKQPEARGRRDEHDGSLIGGCFQLTPTHTG